MKINSIWVSKYKNIEKLSFDFSNDKNIALLIGQNGLGKSNLIEIIALIFRDLDLMKTEGEFREWAYDNFNFLINYQCKGNHIQIDATYDLFNIRIRAVGSEEKDFQQIEIKEFIRRRHNEFLPNYIIGYYSGENKRIRSIIRKYEEIEFESLKKWNEKLTNNDEPKLRRLFFTENHHSQLILLSLLLFRTSNIIINNKRLSERINELLKGYIKIDSFANLRLIFNNPYWVKYIEKKKLGVDFLISNLIEHKDYPFWNLKGKIDKLLNFLLDNHIENPKGYPKTDEKISFMKEVLEYDKFDVNKLSKQCQKEYKKPIDFFDAIEATSIVDILYKIIITSKKIGIKDSIEFSELSEGEQQLITTIGLLLITSDEDCLYLFDEPDTHLNPLWQRDYIELLNNFNLDGTNSHIFVATHSPLIVQAADNADAFLFQEKGKRKVKVEKYDLKNKNWRIDQVLISELFELESSRPPSLDEFMEKRKELLTKPELTKEDIEELQKLTNKFGTLPTGETINEMEAMSIINRAAKNLQND